MEGDGPVCLLGAVQRDTADPENQGPHQGMHDEAGYTVGLSWRRGCSPPSSQRPPTPLSLGDSQDAAAEGAAPGPAAD